METEIITVACPRCGESIDTHWMKDNTGVLPGNFVLAGDYVFHPYCWDKMLKENPPNVIEK